MNCVGCGVQEGMLHQPDCPELSDADRAAMLGEDTPEKHPNLMPPWQPGQSGNPAGRPRGARSKLSEDFFKALAEDFAENGIAAIVSMRTDRPGDYAKMIAALQSKELTGEDGEAIGLAIFKGLNDGPDD